MAILKANFTNLFDNGLKREVKKSYGLGFMVSKRMIEDDFYFDEMSIKPFKKNKMINRLNDNKHELQNKINDVCIEVSKQEDMFDALRDFNFKVNENWNSLGLHQKNLIKNLMKEILDL